MLFSYSQSSMVALVVVTLALAAATGGPRLRKATVVATGVFVAAGLALVIAAALSDDLRQETSDRSDRVSQTVKVIGDHPLLGVGVGGQPGASKEAAESSKPTADFVSHTTPLTVSAELGVAGVLAYLALLLGGARTIASVTRRHRAFGLALGASLLVLVRALAVLPRLPRGPAHLARARAGLRVGGPAPGHPRRPRGRAGAPPGRGRVSRYSLLALCAVLLGLIAITLPELGSDPWPFRPPSTDPQGILAPLVRAAGEEWDVGIARAVAFLAALLVGGVAAVALRKRGPFPAWTGVALALAVALMLLAPSTLLQMGLRQSTEPWFHTNDSTFQIDIAGDLVLDGKNPYGHDYRPDGLDRFYTRDGSVSQRIRREEVALDHFAYFPGAAITGAAWRLLPEPLDDYRLLVLLCTLGLFGAAMLIRAPLPWRVVIGVLLVANPIAVRSAWFGQNDAPSILGVVLAFALVTRGRYKSAAASLAAAVLLKQFAVVAVPFLALMIPRRDLLKAAAVFAGIVVLASLPFFVADPKAFVDDTVKYGAGTYRIVGYGLSAILVRAGIVEDREGEYPFVLFALLLWLPLTVWLLLLQRKSDEPWLGAAGFALSILVLLFVGRTFNNYYLVWPATGGALAALIAVSARTGTSGPSGTPASSRPPPGSRTSPG